MTLGAELRGLPDEPDGMEEKERIQIESQIFSEWMERALFT